VCGIFGITLVSGHGVARRDWQKAVERLFELSESRGKEAAGIAVTNADRIVIHKDSVSASEMLRTDEYHRAMDRALDGQFDGTGNSLAAIGHARLVTNGLQGIDANNQPVRRDDAVIVHNGIVVNVAEIWDRNPDLTPNADVDTEVIAALIEKDRAAGQSPVEAVRRVFSEIYGETSIALFLRDIDAMLLATNTGSLYMAVRPDGKAAFFASEELICERLLEGPMALPGYAGATIRHVPPGHGLLVGLNDLSLTPFSLDGETPTPSLVPGLAAQRTIEDKSERLEEARRNMRRCSKCLLPETMPFIEYDADGVCNFCHTYQPWERKPEAELHALLDRHRSRDGSPDCVMAFSGGRDSSYGLHLLKEKFGMTPITFSYDWGMVTDLARRNQARMCGKLGVEHLWVSADIKEKRAHIRRNVLAWLKKPDLGMIPLFMAGDKEVLMHANRIMRETRIPMMAFCTNRYEKTEFKTGFLGIRSASATIHKPASLSVFDKAGMAARYGARFLSNPAYLNRSLLDTAKAFVSYYVIEQDYFSMFDYVHWDEDEINETLIGEYDWETAPDTDTTWRIGDGTAPFYNYIYYMVAGFTEADTFRSAQIREGVMSREQGLALIEKENQPRWESIREYTQMINIDFDETVRIIDRIPKLYAD
jgi:asparagine synthetase B (glutamine-hydrolysing)